MGGDLMQIGEVAERTGLSLRTIRYYEEVKLVVPSARSQGGFRLYTEADIDRLQVIKRMKPLDFTLDQMRGLLDIIDRLAAKPRLTKSERNQMLDTLSKYQHSVRERCGALRAQLATAAEFDTSLAAHISALGGNPGETIGRRSPHDSNVP
jgi:DNA-binding transcriptional MerR regulator